MRRFFIRLSLIILFCAGIGSNALAMSYCTQLSGLLDSHEVVNLPMHHDGLPHSAPAGTKHLASCLNCCTIFYCDPYQAIRAPIVFSYAFNGDRILVDPLFYPINKPPKEHPQFLQSL